MRLAYSLVPISGALLAIWVMWKYDVTEERAHEIRAELERRRGKTLFGQAGREPTLTPAAQDALGG